MLAWSQVFAFDASQDKVTGMRMAWVEETPAIQVRLKKCTNDIRITRRSASFRPSAQHTTSTGLSYCHSNSSTYSLGFTQAGFIPEHPWVGAEDSTPKPYVRTERKKHV